MRPERPTRPLKRVADSLRKTSATAQKTVALNLCMYGNKFTYYVLCITYIWLCMYVCMYVCYVQYSMYVCICLFMICMHMYVLGYYADTYSSSTNIGEVALWKS